MRKKTYTFIQLNIWKGRLSYPIRRFLDRVQPDILSAQELFSGTEGHRADHITAEMMIDDGYFQNLSLGAGSDPFTDDFHYKRTQHCSTLTKSKLEVLETKNIDLVYPSNLYLKSHINYFKPLHTTLSLNAQKIHVLNYHAPLIKGNRMGNSVFNHYFQQMTDYIKTLNGPVIFSGDFNMYRDASSVQLLKQANIENLNDRYGIDVGRNGFSWKPDEIVCHVFVSPDINVHHYEVAPEEISDHQPLVMEFSL